MATWRRVIENLDYKSLPIKEKLKTKIEFFDKVISKSDKFTPLSSDEQSKIKTKFYLDDTDLFPKEKRTISELAGDAYSEYIRRSPLVTLDKPVEALARWVEPEVPAGRTTLGLLTKDLPRQLTADIIRMYKPSTVGAFYGAAKLLKPLAKVGLKVAKPVGKLIYKKLPVVAQRGLIKAKEVLTREFTIGKGAPKEYLKQAKQAQLEKLKGAREAEDVARKLTTTPAGKMLTPEEQRYVGKIFRKEIPETSELLVHPKYQELKQVSEQGRVIMDKWSTELAKSGIPKKQAKEAIEENVGSYMARMYTSRLRKRVGEVGLFKNLRLRLSGLKHRKDLSEEVRKVMGEIKEPALPTAIRVKEISTSIANNKLFKQIAKNPEWTSNVKISGLVKMPDTATMGALKGKYVIPEIAQDVNAITKVAETSQNLYLKALSAWKFGKVVLNPATQVRNVISNSILLDLSGTPHLRQVKLFPRAFKEHLSKGKIYQQALDDGAIGGEFVGAETMQKMREFYLVSKGGNLEKWMDIARMPFRKAAELYQGSEQLAKMVKYMDVLNRGGTRQMAAQEAQKWLFNYTEIPNFVSFGRTYVAPFMTFTYKALPRLGETLVNRPMALYKYYALSTAFNETSRKLLGMSPVEYARSKKLLPPWLLKGIGGMPTNLLLPFTDKYNRTLWLNLEYILPVGMAPEVMEKGLIRGAISNPLFNILAELKSNMDFRGKAIIPPEPTKEEAMKAVIGHVYRQLMPSLAPGIPNITKGGYSFEKIMDAIKGRPDHMERIRDLTPVLLDTLGGIKINALDVEEAERFKMMNKQKRIEELNSEFYKVYNSPLLKEEIRDEQIEGLFKKIEKILEE